MNATHFIEVYKIGNKFYQSGQLMPITLLNQVISSAALVETIAVWRIKGTDVPLQTRMDLRKWGMGYGRVDDGEIYKIDISQYKFHAHKLENINIPTI